MKRKRRPSGKDKDRCAEKGMGMERKEPERKSFGDRTESGETEQKGRGN